MALYEQIKDVEIFLESIKCKIISFFILYTILFLSIRNGIVLFIFYFYLDLKSPEVANNEKSSAPATKTPLEINVALSEIAIDLATAPGHRYYLREENLAVLAPNRQIKFPPNY